MTIVGGVVGVRLTVSGVTVKFNGPAGPTVGSGFWTVSSRVPTERTSAVVSLTSISLLFTTDVRGDPST